MPKRGPGKLACRAAHVPNSPNRRLQPPPILATLRGNLSELMVQSAKTAAHRHDRRESDRACVVAPMHGKESTRLFHPQRRPTSV